jgi:hypothetical protein
MRKKLALLVFALAALTASLTIRPASALTCPPKTHEVDCPNGHSFCCPNNALCLFC